MGILFEKSGLFTTVQDLGRTGYQKSGFSVSGVMDRRSFMIANLLVDNPENEAVIEFSMVGPTIRFTSDTIIAMTGGKFSPKLNGKPIHMYAAVYVHKGDLMEIGFAETGCWGYLAISSRLDVKNVMGSRSTNTKCSVGGFHGRKIEKNDQIWFRAKKRYLPYFLSRHLEPDDFGKEEVDIRVVMGPQEDAFTKKGIKTFLTEEYTVTADADRMGYRLEGPHIAHKGSADIISDGIPFGAIQVPSHGKPIIMLADRQTTGGYTKIATVIGVDIPKLVQRKPGNKIRFYPVSVKTAQELYRQEIKEFDEMRNKIHHPCKEVLDPRLTAKRLAKLFDKEKETMEVEPWI